jgi:phosphatidate cytidylyltransferase
VFWLFAVVWATDTAAYISGRLIGGPKLAPRFSPNKTWAGLIGGALAAALVGVIAATLMGDAPMPSMALASAGLAVVAQAGDLVESALKRRFGVKDASTLIPGHGGVLDRLDGMLFAAPVFVALMMWTGGVQSWR